jgi:hypothetical protein
MENPKLYIVVKMTDQQTGKRVKSFTVWSQTYSGGVQTAYTIANDVKLKNPDKYIVTHIAECYSVDEQKDAMDSYLYEIFTEQV